MTTTPSNNDQKLAQPTPCVAIPADAIVVLVASMVAAWLAAGSTGLLGHSLQHALTWSALAVALVTAWPRENHSIGTWAILAGSAAVGIAFTASTLPVVNVFAVTVVLAAIAQISRGLTARVALVASLAAGALGLFRLACDAIPSVWLAADGIGHLLGRLAGWLVDSRLEIGSTFAGLDFLILMAAVYVGWLLCTVPPRRPRAIWAAVAIIVGHFAYLAVLAHSEKLLALLPDMVVTPETDINHIGIWTWANGLRSLIPWNVPLLAVAIHSAIAAVMFRAATWLPIIEPDLKALKKLQEKEEKEDVPGSVLAADMLYRFGPVFLAVIAVLLVALALNKSDLKGKTIVAHEKGYLNWGKPEYDSQAEGFYGMLPTFVESLGGKFVTSKHLLEKDLETADVLVLLHPDQPWLEDTLERIWRFVRRGGSLLLVADPVIHEGRSRSSFNNVLQSEIQQTSMDVRYDTAVTRAGNWEQSYEVLAHPATLGIDDLRNHFGLELGSSIRTAWPARPVLVGRWGWSDPGSDAINTGVSHYNAGELLGDLVLAAEQPVDSGRVFVLGGAAPLRNEMLTNAYPFVGRLLGYLANKPASPQVWWRQLLGFLTLVALGVLVARRPAAWQLILTPTILAVTLICCAEAAYWSGRVLPDGRNRVPSSFNNIAYIDASHLEAYSSDFGSKQGISGLMRTLMRQGYLPLLAPDLTSERLERAGLLISIAPAKRFSVAEQDAVKQFVENGGTFISMVGAEQARASASLLADFDFVVPPSPVPPCGESVEPEPLGAFQQVFNNKRYVRFYTGWPVECTASTSQPWVLWSNGKADRKVIVSHSEQGGVVAVIGDTNFAINENLEAADSSLPDNIRFWHWMLSHMVPGQKAWNPPPADPNAVDANTNENESDEDEPE